ncbi:MAG: hypothetical protein V4454_14260 [Pseudomonadota bacterium]
MTELIAGDVDGVLPVNRLVFEQLPRGWKTSKGFLKGTTPSSRLKVLKSFLNGRAGEAGDALVFSYRGEDANQGDFETFIPSRFTQRIA